MSYETRLSVLVHLYTYIYTIIVTTGEPVIFNL